MNSIAVNPYSNTPGHVTDYLIAAASVTKLQDDLFYALTTPDEVNLTIVRQWQQYLFERGQHPETDPADDGQNSKGDDGAATHRTASEMNMC